MPARIAISKKIRFEVFKRAKFICQYCGNKAPDIVLQLDHIQPVAKGGKNDIINLITSCFDCNNGKRDKELTDNTAIEKQRKQMELLEERREQLELMLEWKKSLSNFDQDNIDLIAGYINGKIAHYSLNNSANSTISQWIKKYSFEEILNGIDEAARVYLKYRQNELIKESIEVFFDKIGGILYIKNLPPLQQKLSYIKSLGKKKFSSWDEQKAAIILNSYVKALEKHNWTEEAILDDLEKEILPTIKSSNNWSEWKSRIEKWIGDINNWGINEHHEQNNLQSLKPIRVAEIACEFCGEDSNIKEYDLDINNTSAPILTSLCESCASSEWSYRKEDEENLLYQLARQKFSYKNISILTIAIERMNIINAPSFMSDLISWILRNDVVMENLSREYIKDYNEMMKKWNEQQDDLPF